MAPGDIAPRVGHFGHHVGPPLGPESMLGPETVRAVVERLATAPAALPPPRPWPLHRHPALYPGAHAVDWALVACFFNPAQHRRPIHNLGAFLDWTWGNRLPLFMAELSFHDARPVLPCDSPQVVHFRLRDEGVLFQKEALLSRLVLSPAVLPPQVGKVFLVDADVVYDDPQAFARAAALLDQVRIVQPFAAAVWQDATGGRWRRKAATAWALASSVPSQDALDPVRYHPGFGIGLRRDFFRRCGELYGCPISGTGDCTLWQAAFGGEAGRLSAWVPEDWRRKVRAYFATAPGTLGALAGWVPGDAVHFWHGGNEARAYSTRRGLAEQFSAEHHIARDPATGLPVWTAAGRPLQEAMGRYFTSRDEDAL